MPKLHSYLNFAGQTEEAFEFYRSVFGGRFTRLQRFSDTEFAEKLPPEEREKIMHIALPIGQDSLLMGSDVLESQGQKLLAGNNVSITVLTSSREETDRLFHGLAEAGQISMPLQETFWGAYFGMLRDRYGIQWMISFEQG